MPDTGWMPAHDVEVQAGDTALRARLTIPLAPDALIVFAHGSGSGRFSPRNRLVAELLHEGAFATLLLDLLTEDEHDVDRHTAQHRFNIPRLAARLLGALEWARDEPRLRDLPVGLFGASTGAAAALLAASLRPTQIGAIVSRGGRPDLAFGCLRLVRAPTLLLVGSEDRLVLALNRQAAAELTAVHALETIDGATHLFEEPGALTQVGTLARQWFLQHLLRQDAPA